MVYPFVVGAVAFRNFGKIARALWRNHEHLLRHLAGNGKSRLEVAARFLHDVVHDYFVEGVHARVVELRGDGAVDRHVVYLAFPQVVVALVLLSDIAQSIECAAFVEFVECNDVCEVEHVDFLELRCRAVFRGHDVQRNIGMVEDFGIRLANSGGF